LSAKILQNLANGVPFQQDKKEAYMLEVNAYIQNHMELMQQTLVDYATIMDGETAYPIRLSEEQRESDLGKKRIAE
jgi:hypothetical protein